MKSETVKIPNPSKSELLRDAAEDKLKKLTIKYFGEAKDASFQKDAIFKKFETQWKEYCYIVNNRQKVLKIYPDAFKKRVDYVMEHVKKQANEKLNEANREKDQSEDSISQK